MTCRGDPVSEVGGVGPPVMCGTSSEAGEPTGAAGATVATPVPLVHYDRFNEVMNYMSRPKLFHLTSAQSVSVGVQSGSHSGCSFLTGSSSLGLNGSTPSEFTINASSMTSTNLQSYRYGDYSFTIHGQLTGHSPSGRLVSSTVNSS